MNEQKWEKLAAFTGLGALILWGIGFALTGTGLKNPTGAEVLTWATDKRDAALLAAYLNGLGAVLFVWWLGSLRSYLRSAESRAGRLSAVAFGAGIVSLGVGMAAEGMRVLLVLRLPEGGDPAMAQFLHDGVNVFYSATWFPWAALTAAVGVLTMRHRAFPRWFGLISYAAAIASLIAAYGVTATTGAFSPSGAVTMLAYGVFSVWFIVGVVLLIQRVGKEPAA